MGEEKWAGPGPTGFAAFSMVCLTIYLSINGYVPKENVPVMFALLTGGAVAQILAGMVDLRKGVPTAGNLLLSFGTMFMLSPALTFLLVGLKVATPAPLLGYINVLLGIFMAVYCIPLLRAPFIPFLIGPIGFLVLTSLGLVELGYTVLKPFSSVLFAVSIVYGLYMMAFTLGEGAHIHLPVGKPLMPLKVPVSEKR